MVYGPSPQTYNCNILNGEIGSKLLSLSFSKTRVFVCHQAGFHVGNITYNHKMSLKMSLIKIVEEGGGRAKAYSISS